MKRLALLLAIAALAQCKRVPEPAAHRSSEIAPPPVTPATSAKASDLPGDGSPLSAVAPAQPIGESDTLTSDAKAAGAIRFAVIGDFGSSTPPEAQVANLVKGWHPDFLITLGDNNYPAGEATTIDANIGRFYAEFIGNYHGRHGPGSKTNRFWPSPGNHDWISRLVPYLEYFTLPGNERYYDVDLGSVHLYALDSDVNEPDGISADSRQAMWLKERLTASKACFDIVYFHHPAYTTAAHGPTLAMRWPFRAWGAEAVLAGHDHTYERFLIDGIPYFVNGLGGEATYEFAGEPMPETKFRYNEQHGAMRVTATPADITYEFFTIDGQKRDAFTFPGHCRN
ncbi:MAG TPA: metallophosphoesterase [Polyangiaceae bacterium]|nr:metallophosphoesterase [Polyangiaceae bacterium]